VVLGGAAAERLGVTTVGSQIILGGLPFTVLGILDPVVLAPELENAAMIPKEFAAEHFAFTGSASTIYERSSDDTVAQVRALLPATIDPAAPEGVEVSRPSDALAAKFAADEAFAGLLLGLGSVALLVGGIGVANTMIISVLERRREIGLRRALGATRTHIRQQFLVEAILLSTLGGLTGALLGVAVTAVFTLAHGWILAIPPGAVVGAVIATAIIGGLAGVQPAVRAARTPPTAALNS
jgi:putative ABC transport system permease protein